MPDGRRPDRLRLATYNVEWFDALFGNDGRLLMDDEWSARRDVTRAQQLEALGIVFTALDADGVMVIEAPDTSRRRDGERALENFAAAFDLRARRALTGFANHTKQEITFLYDPDVLSARHDPQDGGPRAPRFDQSFEIDLDIDDRVDTVTFSKPPLELAVHHLASGLALRLIGVHLKSKAPHGARSRRDATRIGIANRRKQLAQAIWLRRRIRAHLERGESLIVMGDLNDGPGLDEHEELFGRSSVEIVLGRGEDGTELCDPNATRALAHRFGAHATSARFWLEEEGRYGQALLDYVMLSPDLCSRNPHWRIWHPLDDPTCFRTPELRDALLVASDHFPVSVDLDV